MGDGVRGCPRTPVVTRGQSIEGKGGRSTLEEGSMTHVQTAFALRQGEMEHSRAPLLPEEAFEKLLPEIEAVPLNGWSEPTRRLGQPLPSFSEKLGEPIRWFHPSTPGVPELKSAAQ